MQQPTGFVKKEEEDKLYKLKKALYDLKQTPRAWYNKIETNFVGKALTNFFVNIHCLQNQRREVISHWFAAKRILRYLKGTTELGIHYKKRENTNVVAYTDCDFAGDIDDRKSTSGFVFLLGSRAISWSSKKQPVVSLSTTEVEYIVVASCACQCIWIQRVLEKLLKSRRTHRFCDNNSTIQLSKNPVFHGWSKHIDIKFHFLRDLVKDGVVKLSYRSSQNQVVDIMTKPLKLEQFLRFRNMLDIVEASKLN